jgi:hypothetical protein
MAAKLNGNPAELREAIDEQSIAPMCLMHITCVGESTKKTIGIVKGSSAGLTKHF